MTVLAAIILTFIILVFGAIALSPLIFGEYQPYKKMPSDPLNNPASSILNKRETVEVRRAYPAGPEKPQWLEGKLTFIGLALSLAGMIGKHYGLNLPTDEVKDFLTWLAASWDDIAQGAGILIAAWGRLRINFRKP